MLLNIWTRKALVLLILAIFALYSALSLLRARPRQATSPQAPAADAPKISWMCGTYPDDGTIAVSLKTGATEASRKLPPLLKTTLSCVQNLMVFSDLEQTINGLHVHDVLSTIDFNLTKGNPDFDLYRKQQELRSQDRESEIEALSAMTAPRGGPEAEGKNAAWALDKYKLLHILGRAFELQPNRDWYVFVETDTYLSWPNLKRWLAGEDSTAKSFFGNALPKSNGKAPAHFAHGGSGFVLSGAAMKELAIDHADLAHRYDPLLEGSWAGDVMLADILFKEMSLEVRTTWPMFYQQDSDNETPDEVDLNMLAITAYPVEDEESQRIYGLELELEFNASGMRFRDLVDILTSKEMEEA